MTGFLASVENLSEARLAAAAGADIIDLKSPRAGALGALPVATVREIVTALGTKQPLSATVGDLPMEPATVLEATRAMADTGVDFVKIGLFPGGNWTGTIEALATVAYSGIKLVAVLFGDGDPRLAWLTRLASAGFAGMMLDTMDKRHGPLTEICSPRYLRNFVDQVHSHGLLCGLAGSLRATDIPALTSLAPDYLGFRGALCRDHQRTSELDATALNHIRALLQQPPPSPPIG